MFPCVGAVGSGDFSWSCRCTIEQWTILMWQNHYMIICFMCMAHYWFSLWPLSYHFFESFNYIAVHYVWPRGIRSEKYISAVDNIWSWLIDEVIKKVSTVVHLRTTVYYLTQRRQPDFYEWQRERVMAFCLRRFLKCTSSFASALMMW